MKRYKIDLDNDVLEPEESLFEAISPDSRIERPIKSGFFIIFYFAIAAVFLIFGAAAFNLGIVKGSYFADLSAKNRFISIPVAAQRGLIYSKDGEILADNREIYDLWFLSSKFPAVMKEEVVLKISEVLDMPSSELLKMIENNRNKSFFLVKESLTEKEKEELASFGLSGLVVAKNTIRFYPEGEIFSHLVGYVSLVNEEDINKNSSYRISDQIGRSGLENFYENELKGRRGEILLDRFEDEGRAFEPEKGDSLVLNIDSKLQSHIYGELERALKDLGSRSGVAAAIDPRDGRVLSLVSLPSYDNNAFVGGLSQENFRLFFENRREPMLNRVISGRFSPGSTIKPIIALAALEESVINSLKKINAPGFITIENPYNPEIVYTFRDWRNHGWVNMREAIANSSDIYFYTVGGGFYDVDGLGISRITEYFKKFKLNSVLGIDLKGELAGFFPTPEWKKEYRNEIWYQGDTFNVSIGQGDLLITPLWLVSYIGAIGNGHYMYRPFIADKILDESGAAIKKFEPEVIQEFNFGKENLEVVREGMEMAAEKGTAKVLADLPFRVGAKSGTAEVIKGQSTSSWITVFAPYDNPQIALTIMMESGKEGSYTPHQIAYRILKEYFK